MSRGKSGLNKLYPKLEIQYELWTLNDEGGWNKEKIEPHRTEGYSWEHLFAHLARQTAVMPNCPAKIMVIHEFAGN